MKLSIIIPTLNEEDHIGRILEHLFKQIENQDVEVIVSDAGSTDDTHVTATRFPVIWIESKVKSRAIQMNMAANLAKGEILYFVHADCLPPTSFYSDVIREVESGFEIGGYRFKFKTNKKILAINSWFTRFNKLTFRGGDQTIFITKKLFNSLGGYKEEYCIMEEYDLMLRAKEAKKPFKLIPKDVMVSDRKYEHNSYFRVNIANLIAMRMFKQGKDPEEIKKKYYSMLNHPKDMD